MKKNLVNTVFFVLILMWVPTGLMGQSMVASVGVDKDDIDLRGSVQILDSLTVQIAEEGKALLRFDGYCTASPGDKIFLAVSETRIWGACDDNINIEVPDNDVNMAPFSHTRVFDLMPGSHTFYAVAHNHIELEGSGIGSIHGNLLLEFFPASGPVLIGFEEIALDNRYVRENTFIFGSTALLIPETGKVSLTFDGLCVSTAGDLIALAGSRTTDLNAQNGAVLVEALSGDLNTNSFSHHQVYEVPAGLNVFYALAENFEEMDGNGRISVFASLTAVYYPDKINTSLLSSNVAYSAIDIRTADRALSSFTIESENGGQVLAQFSGMASISPGDRIYFDIAGGTTLPPEPGNMILETWEADKPYRSFSHTRLFNIGPGEHDFYLLARNKDEVDGTGVISTFGNFSVVYEGHEVTSAAYETTADLLTIAPNPCSDILYLDLQALGEASCLVDILDLSGRIVYRSPLAAGHIYSIDVSTYSAGLYLIRIKGADGSTEARKLVIR